LRAFLSFCALLVVSCGSSIPSGAVMVVGDRVLYPGDVTAAMERAGGDSTAVRVMRDNILARELFLYHAGELGLDTLREVRREMYERRREVLQSAYLQWVVEDVTISPEELAAFRDSLGIIAVYSSFFTKDSLAMQQFMARLDQGEYFNRLVAELTDDEFIRQTTGIIGPIPLARTNRPDYAVLRAMQPGQVSDVIPLSIGWRVIRLDTLYHEEQDSLALQDGSTERILFTLRRESRRQQAQDELVSEVNLQVSSSACSLIASRAQSSWGDYLPFDMEEEEIAAITWEGGHRSLISLAMNITYLPSQLPRNATDPDWIENYAFYLGLYDVQAMVATSLGLDTIPVNASLISKKQGETLLDEYYSAVLRDRIVIDEELLDRHFHAAADTMLIPEKRVYIHAAGQGSAQVALINRIFVSGEDPLNHADQLIFVPQLSASQASALTRPLGPEDIPEAHRERLMSLEPGEAAVCSIDTDFHVYFKLVEVIPEHAPELDEIRHVLEPRVRAEVEVLVISELVDSLKEAYRPYIDEAFFDSFIDSQEPRHEDASSDDRLEENR